MYIRKISKKKAKNILAKIKETSPESSEARQSKDMVVRYLESTIKDGIVYDDLKKHLVDQYALSFKDGSISDLVSNFTVGFELETQSTNGVQYSDVRSKVEEYNNNLKVSSTELKAARRKEFDDRLQSDKGIKVIAKYKTVRAVISDIIAEEYQKLNDDADVEEVKEELESNFKEKMVHILKSLKIEGVTTASIIAKLTKSWADKSTKALEKDIEKTLDITQLTKDRHIDERKWKDTMLLPHAPNEFDIKSDGSVSGFEIATKGAWTVQEFVRGTGKVFDPSMNHEITKGCSFHIHVGVKNRELTYTKNMQKHIYTYLLENIKKFPKSVTDRLNGLVNDHSGNYKHHFCRFVSPDKYSFVHFHREYKTWEFRCWGNIDNKKDAIQCLMLSLRALAYALAKEEETATLPDDQQLGICIDDVKALSKVAPDPKIMARANRRKRVA